MHPADSTGASDVTHHEATVNGVRLHYVRAGEEPARPIILLHGFPQSWIMWRFVIPALSENHNVVAVDLRGYGDSEKPPDYEAGHDQRTKASDIRALADHLGFDEFLLVGHDRGARVSRRYALDHPETLVGVAFLDILPSEYIYDELSAAEVAERYWHWVFQIVPDLPQRLIAGNEDAYLERFFSRTPSFLDKLRRDGSFDEYLRTFLQPDAVAAAMHDYRATFEVDVPRYREEKESGVRVSTPSLLLWGDRGNLVGRPIRDIWSRVASDIRGAFEIPECGHYLPEERPEIVTEHLLNFAEEVWGRR